MNVQKSDECDKCDMCDCDTEGVTVSTRTALVRGICTQDECDHKYK